MRYPSVTLPSHARADREEQTHRLLAEAEVTACPQRRKTLHEEAILVNRDLALRIAHRYRRRGVEIDDLNQVAMLALCKAISGYRPREGATFAAYAIPTISGELRRHFRDHAWAVRPPRRLQELSALVRAAESDLIGQLGSIPTARDLARHLGISEADVDRARQANSSFRAASLDAPLGQDTTLGDVLPAWPGELERLDSVLALRQAVASLPERERRVLTLRFALDMTQADIGREVGLSQMHVSRILGRTLLTLRSALAVERVAS